MGFNLGKLLGGVASNLNPILGVGGLLLSQDQNRKAARDAGDAERLQREMIKRNKDAADAFLKEVQMADQAGVYDATRSLNNLQAQHERALNTSLGNVGGVGRVMGYSPGDSEVINAVGDTANKYRLDYNQQAEGLRQQAAQNRLGAYQTAYGMQQNAAGNGFQMGSGLYNQAQGRQSDPSALIASVQPFLAAKKKVGSPAEADRYAPAYNASESGNYVGTNYGPRFFPKYK